ncbi:ribonuclease H-like domain-containing protein [Tanacetum coccineum]
MMTTTKILLLDQTKEEPDEEHVGIKRLFEAVWKLLLLSAASIKVETCYVNYEGKKIPVRILEDDFVDVNESASESIVKKPTVDTNEPKTARKEDGASIIKDWVSKSKEEDVPKIKTVEMFNKPRPNAVVNTPRPKAVLSAVNGKQGKFYCYRAHMKETDSILLIIKKLMEDIVHLNEIPKEGLFNGKRLNKIGIENLIDLKVKVIRCNNGTEFKNRIMNQFCEMKGIKREFSVARTPQQNGVVERKNRTLIEAARTMLADSKLPTTFWAKVVNTACYVQNRVLVIKPHNKTPYELFLGRKPALSFMRPFRCPVTILNTIDHRGKFDGNVDEGFFVDTITNSKAFRLFNGTKACDDADSKSSPDAGFKPSGGGGKRINAEDPRNEDSEVTNNAVAENIVYGCADDPNMPELEEISRFSDAEDNISGVT